MRTSSWSFLMAPSSSSSSPISALMPSREASTSATLSWNRHMGNIGAWLLQASKSKIHSFGSHSEQQSYEVFNPKLINFSAKFLIQDWPAFLQTLQSKIHQLSYKLFNPKFTNFPANLSTQNSPAFLQTFNSIYIHKLSCKLFNLKSTSFPINPWLINFLANFSIQDSPTFHPETYQLSPKPFSLKLTNISANHPKFSTCSQDSSAVMALVLSLSPPPPTSPRSLHRSGSSFVPPPPTHSQAPGRFLFSISSTSPPSLQHLTPSAVAASTRLLGPCTPPPQVKLQWGLYFLLVLHPPPILHLQQ